MRSTNKASWYVWFYLKNIYAEEAANLILMSLYLQLFFEVRNSATFTKGYI